MQVSRITSSLMNTVNTKNVSFNGHFRSVEVEENWNDIFTAKVAGTRTDEEYFIGVENAVTKTIMKARDFIKNSTVEKINDIKINKKERLGVAEVYFSDENEKIDMKNIEKYADYIVYAPGSEKA